MISNLLVITIAVLLGNSLAIELTEAEKDALSIFTDMTDDIKLKPYQRSESYLLRWLKATNFDALEALERLQVAQKWRKDNNIDGILNETIPMKSGYIVSMTGIDGEGRPILTKSMKKLDLFGIVESGNKESFIRYNIQVLERMNLQARYISELSGVDLPQIYSILDFDGVKKSTLSSPDCMEAIIRLYFTTLRYYPGLVAREVWINTPRNAEFLVNSIRVLYSTLSKEHFHVFNNDKDAWSAFLRKSIPEDQLTKQFGGSRHL